MKRTVILVLVGGLLLGLVYIGLSPQSSSAAPPQQPPQQPPGASVQIVNPLDDQGNVKVSLLQPVQVTAKAPLPVSLQEAHVPSLLTIAQNLTLEPGERVLSEYLDVKSFRLFKVYARVTPYVSETPPAINVRVYESAAGVAGEKSYGSIPADYEWKARGTPPERWVIASNFDGLYSKIMVYAKNEGVTPVSISLYLLMAKE